MQTPRTPPPVITYADQDHNSPAPEGCSSQVRISSFRVVIIQDAFVPSIES